MAAGWKTVRVFISSTFRDMHRERDHLVRVVFPELKERCRTKHVQLVDVDLRWGVTEADAEHGKALDICLDEIDSCRPYFLGILGHRYGFVPEGHRHSITAQEVYHGVLHGSIPKQVVDLRKILEEQLEGQTLSSQQKDGLVRCYKWVADTRKYLLQEDVAQEDADIIRSVFERYSIYQKDRSFFFFRSEALSRQIAGTRTSDFFEQNPEDRDKLDALKEEIVAADLPHFEYDDIEAFGQLVLNTLWKRIEVEAEQAPSEERDWLGKEAELHELFMADRTRRFVGRRDLLERMHAFCNSDENPSLLGITGEPGCGKSALMARFTEEASRNHPNWLLLGHFVGASPASTSLRQMLRRLCTHLTRATGANEDAPEDIKELLKLFPELLTKASEQRDLLIIIDAVNQLEELDHAHSMHWLPQVLPQNVRVVISTLKGEAHDAMLQRRMKPQEETVIGLAAPEIRELAGTYLREIRHEFPNLEVERDFYRKVEQGNPLYILVALEELRVFGEFEELGSRINRLPDNVPALFDQVLERIEMDFNPALVGDCMSYIACGRHGMTAEELQTLLKAHAPRIDPNAEAPKLPDMLWRRLYRSLSGYLFERSGVIDFFHGQLKEAVGKRYLHEERGREAAHQAIADYLMKRWREPYARALDELPHQQMRARNWQALVEILCDLQFIELKCQAGMTYDLVADYESALSAEAIPLESRSSFDDFARFVRSQSHVLVRNPALTFQQAGNEPDSTAPARAALSRMEAGLETRPWFQNVNKPQSLSACLMTLVSHTKEVEACAFSPDGSRIVSASRDQTLKLWDAKTGEELTTLAGHTHGVSTFTFSADGHLIVSASEDKTLKLWDAKTGTELATLAGHTCSVRACAFSADGCRIVSGSEDRTLKLWDATTGVELATLVGRTDYARAFSGKLERKRERKREYKGEIAFCLDGGRDVSASRDDTLKLWDAEAAAELANLAGHTWRVTGCAFSPDGSRIVSALSDNTLKLWDAQSGAELATLLGHTSSVRACAFSPDGSRMVSASEDKTLKLWYAQIGREPATLAGHTSYVNSCGFSPDGNSIVSASSDNTLRLWDAETGVELATLAGHTGYVKACSFSPDGHRIASASEDKNLKLWDAHTGAELATLAGHTRGVTACNFSVDGSRLVSASRDQTLKVWDAQTGAELATLAGHTGAVTACAFSSDGSHLVSASEDKTLKLWDAQTGVELVTLAGHTSWVKVCAFSAKGSRIVSGSEDKTLKLWDAQTGAELATFAGRTDYVRAFAGKREREMAFSHAMASPSFRLLGKRPVELWEPQTGAELATLAGHTWRVTGLAFSPDGDRIVSARTLWDGRTGAELAALAGHTSYVNACTFSPDGSRIVSASGDQTLKLWDAKTGAELATLAGHKDSVNACDFSPDGSRLVSASNDLTLKVWDAHTGAELATCAGHRGSVKACAFSPDGRRIVSASDDNTLKLWDAQTRAEPAAVARQTSYLRACTFSPDGSRIVSASNDSAPLKLWDAQTGAELAALWGHTGLVKAWAFSPDGSRLVSASYDSTLKLWDTKTGAELATLAGHTRSVKAWAFSPDGGHIVSASDDSTLKLWDAETGAELATLVGHTKEVPACAFSPDGHRIVSASHDSTLKLWDAKTGSKLATLAGHSSYVTACTFSPDGSRIVSASYDSTLKVWDSKTGGEVATLAGHTREVHACAFSPDGHRIVSASEDKTLKLWDAQTGAKLATLSGHTYLVFACIFSPDGGCIVSASLDKTLKLWDARTGAELATLAGHTKELHACAFSPDGHYIVSATEDKTLKLWDAQTGVQIGEYEIGVLSEAAAWSPRGFHLASGDSLGHLLILRLQNVSVGPVLVTAWEDNPRRWIPWRRIDLGLHVGCPLCRVWSEVPSSALGAVIPCPNCGESVKLNPFTINADWRPIAAAWKTTANDA